MFPSGFHRGLLAVGQRSLRIKRLSTGPWCCHSSSTALWAWFLLSALTQLRSVVPTLVRTHTHTHTHTLYFLTVQIVGWLEQWIACQLVFPFNKIIVSFILLKCRTNLFPPPSSDLENLTTPFKLIKKFLKTNKTHTPWNQQHLKRQMIEFSCFCQPMKHREFFRVSMVMRFFFFKS